MRLQALLERLLKAFLRTVISVIGDLVAIGRELLVWPARLWMGAAETAGRIVLAAWIATGLPLLRLGRRVWVAALRIGEREVTPTRGLAVVALAATIGLGASQFADYRAVEVGAPQYTGVENVAPAPEVDQASSRSAHGVTVFAIAVAALFVTLFAIGKNWRLARLLIVLGGAALVISLAVDAPQGLRTGTAAIAYEGAKATLLAGFWAQLWCAVTLILVGPLLAASLRGERARDGRRASLSRPRVAGAISASAGGSGVKGTAT